MTVLGPKSIAFDAAGQKNVTLTLTRKGRAALRNLSSVSLVITAKATNAFGETVQKSLPLRLGT